MKKLYPAWAWVTGLALVCSFIWLLITMQSAIQQEYLAVWSYAARDEVAASAVHDITFADGGNNLLAEQGRQVLEQAGYLVSLPRAVDERVFSSCAIPFAAVFSFLIAAGLCIGKAVYRNHREISGYQTSLQMKDKQMDALRSEIEQMKADIEQYEGNLYHQIKTPLTGLRLVMEKLTCEDQAAHASLLRFDQLDRLLRTLLREKQLSASAIKMQYRPAMLNDMIEDAIQRLSPQLKLKGSRVTFQAEKDECVLICDELWLAECVLVLLDNAVEHAPLSSIIRVTLKENQGHYRIDIVSDGVLPQDALDGKIFQRFYSTSQSHFGIGLHMAKSIAQMHHGELRAYNLPDERAVSFELTLPILQDSRSYSVT